MLAGGASRALAESSVLNAVTPNRTGFAVSDGCAASIGNELSCRARDALGVVLGTVVLANRAHFASASDGSLARSNSTGHVGSAASVVSVGPCSTSAGGARGFAGGGGIGGASASFADAGQLVLAWCAIDAAVRTHRTRGRTLTCFLA
jgi:hypothetical protein